MTNIVVCTKVEEKHLEQMKAVDPRIRVADASAYLRMEIAKSASAPAWYQKRQGQDAGMTLDEARREVDEMLKDAEILYSHQLPSDVLRRAPNLRWVQNAGAGVEHLVGSGVLNSRVVVTNVSGIAARPIAEFVMCLMLMFSRGACRFIENQRLKKWDRFLSTELLDKTVGIVGLGHIGTEVATLARGFGMRAMAIRKSARERRESVEGVDMLLPHGDLSYLLANSDFVVLSVPSTDETNSMIGEAELRAMKPTSYLINIARGPVIDEPVLVRALKEHWIAGAGLDVFRTEPLPLDSELWTLDNVILTPHIAGPTDRYNDRAIAFFCNNLKKYLKGEGLVNIVNGSAGY